MEHALLAKRRYPGLTCFTHRWGFDVDEIIFPEFPGASDQPLQWNHSGSTYSLSEVDGPFTSPYIRIHLTERYEYTESDISSDADLYDPAKYHPQIVGFRFGRSRVDLVRWADTYIARTRSGATPAKLLSFTCVRSVPLHAMLYLLQAVGDSLETFAIAGHAVSVADFCAIAKCVRCHNPRMKSLRLDVDLASYEDSSREQLDLSEMLPISKGTLEELVLDFGYSWRQGAVPIEPVSPYELAHCAAWLTTRNAVIECRGPYGIPPIGIDIEDLIGYLRV